MAEDDITRILSRKLTRQSGTLGSDLEFESVLQQDEIAKLMSRMFGKKRQAHSEYEKVRHVGLVFRHLTVRGFGIGAALQQTLRDRFLGLPRFIKALISRDPKKIADKHAIRTIINGFTGCIKPGEMLLVLGRPGSGCSTLLKVLPTNALDTKVSMAKFSTAVLIRKLWPDTSEAKSCTILKKTCITLP